jgi:hypothetical protein
MNGVKNQTKRRINNEQTIDHILDIVLGVLCRRLFLYIKHNWVECCNDNESEIAVSAVVFLAHTGMVRDEFY